MKNSTKDLLRLFADEVHESLSWFHDMATVGGPDETETKAYDGFIPYTDGGFTVTGYADFASAYGSGCVPVAIQDMLDSTLEKCRREFEREHGVDPWEMDDDHELREEWYEYENTWLSEGTTYFYRVRALFYEAGNRHGEEGYRDVDHVYFDAYINTDLEYGRDYIAWAGGNQTHGGWKRVIKADRLNEKAIRKLAEEAINNIGEYA